jgi:membrane-anchored protein YejM (alkaline phosphatase superfamily)
MSNHFSSGNCTPQGMLGLFYSVTANYLYATQSQGLRCPALDVFSELGYQWRILASADLGYSCLDTTAFRPFKDSITDHWDCPPVERDARMTSEFIRFLDGRKGTNAPFFGFLFYDASHFPYYYPDEDAVFPAQDLRS